MTLITGLTLTGFTGAASAAEPGSGAKGGAQGSGVAAAVSDQPQRGVGIWGS
ncbi:hypothetical protein [Streptomyces sp. NPDC058157]|uniref:hypothetical protein n=1 Tax=Streptomyces sp. NPDC058157 TaxID=3346360 RepID=UPI0036E31B4D